MNLPFEKIGVDEIGMKEIAHEFSSLLTGGDVIALIGNLGSGKTFFVKQVCKKFNIDNVSSPSFAIVNEYSGRRDVNHFDFYRIKRVEELFDLGFSEYLDDEFKVTFIEWADMFPEVLPKKFYRINLEIIAEGTRKISITKNE